MDSFVALLKEFTLFNIFLFKTINIRYIRPKYKYMRFGYKALKLLVISFFEAELDNLRVQLEG